MTPATVPAGTYSALGHAFSLWSSDAEVAAHLRALYRAMPPADAPAVSYGIEVRGRAAVEPFLVHTGDRRSAPQHSLGRALALLASAINRAVVARAHDQPLVHAASAARDGRCVVLPGGMESGKSTLVTALLRTGWAYLSDEAVLLDTGSRTAVGLRKPISLDRGSWDLFPDLRPRGPAPVLSSVAEHQWQVAPQHIGGVAPCSRAEVAVIVFPHYGGPTATTELTPLRRTDALALLLHCAFRAGASPGRFAELAELARAVPAFRLVTGALDDAVAMLTTALEDCVAVRS